MNKKTLTIAASAVTLLALACLIFYWASIRPVAQRAECDRQAREDAAYDFVLEGSTIVPKTKSLENGYSQKRYELNYRNCTRAQGLD